MKKKYPLYVIILAVIIALSIAAVSVAFAADNIAGITPENVTENYIRFNNPTLIAKSETLTAVLDGGVVRVFDKDNRELGQIAGGADAIAIAGGGVYVALNHRLTRYAVEDGAVSQGVSVTDKVISRLLADDGYVYFVDDANAVYRYDGTSITEIAIEKITYVFECLLAADNGVIYSYKNGEMSAAGKTQWNTVASGARDASKFYVVNGEPLTLSSDSKTVAYRDKKIMSDTPLDIYVSGGKIYLLDNADKSFSECDTDLNKIVKTGSSGSEADRLNSPSAISAGDTKIFVADNGNNRVSVYDSETGEYSTVNAAQAIDKISATQSGFAAYSAAANKIFVYTKNANGIYTPTSEIDADGDVIDIASWNNDVLALKSDGSVISCTASAEAARLHGATDTYINHKTSVLYIAAPTRLTRKNLLTGAEQTYIHSESFTDFAVDYGGNIYFMTDKSLRRFKPSGSVLEPIDEYALSGLVADFTAAFSPLGDLYIAEKSAHKLSRIPAKAIGAVSDKSYSPPDKSDFTLIRGAELPIGSGLYTTPGNEETLITLREPVRFLALTKINYLDKDYYYGLNYSDGEYYYVLTSDTELLSATELPSDYPKYNSLLATGVKVYAFPYESAEIIATADFNTRITLLNNVANVPGDAWGWYKVAFTLNNAEYIGYVRDYEVAKVTAVEPPQKSQFYKVNSGALGTIVKVYSEPYADSEALFDISDGASVLVVEAFDKAKPFTYIYYDGAYGYIETQYLIAEGLTTVQITAIIVISICAAALLVACPLFYMLYKRSKKPRGAEEEK